jgi:3,4-dihydroxy 2-butanone 4-phosphate synthase/GTP cyclohydrolase II
MNKIKQVLADLKVGKPVVVVDDYDREFEGDLVIAAEKASKENLIFAMNHAKGLMCLPCLKERCDRLDIPMMRSNGGDKLGTPFTVSIDANEDTTTGMSVYDRLKTIEVFLNEGSQPHQLSQPGHLFPLMARPGLLKERRGHTESSIELMKLAGFKEVAIIIEIMNNQGTMVKGKDLETYAKIYDLTLISVEEIYEAVYNS